MSYRDLILNEIAQLSQHQLKQVMAYLQFLKVKDSAMLQDSIGVLNKKNKPAFGCGAYKVVVHPDFDAPIEDLKEYMI